MPLPPPLLEAAAARTNPPPPPLDPSRSGVVTPPAGPAPPPPCLAESIKAAGDVLPLGVGDDDLLAEAIIATSSLSSLKTPATMLKHEYQQGDHPNFAARRRLSNKSKNGTNAGQDATPKR